MRSFAKATRSQKTYKNRKKELRKQYKAGRITSRERKHLQAMAFVIHQSSKPPAWGDALQPEMLPSIVQEGCVQVCLWGWRAWKGLEMSEQDWPKLSEEAVWAGMDDPFLSKLTADMDTAGRLADKIDPEGKFLDWLRPPQGMVPS